MSPIKRPSYLRIDALKELGNIGAGHAVTGLAKLLKKRIDVNVTSVDLIPVKIIYNFFNGPESMVSVVYIEGYSEGFRGMMFLIFPHPEATRLVELATGKIADGREVLGRVLALGSQGDRQHHVRVLPERARHVRQ